LLGINSVQRLSEAHLDRETNLLLSAAQGSQAAFVTLFHRHKHKLYSYTLRLTQSEMLAEDVVQDVFMKLWTDRAAMASIDNFGNYIFRMAKNQVLNHFKRVAHEMAIVSEMFREGDHAGNNAQEMLAAREVEQVLQSVVEALPPQQKAIYRLSRDEGKSHEEIAGLLKISPNTVKNHMVQAMATIRYQLRRHADSLIVVAALLALKK
jgi:RNA polymerase sigma-70 factor (family 1)